MKKGGWEKINRTWYDQCNKQYDYVVVYSSSGRLERGSGTIKSKCFTFFLPGTILRIGLLFFVLFTFYKFFVLGFK